MVQKSRRRTSSTSAKSANELKNVTVTTDFDNQTKLHYTFSSIKDRARNIVIFVPSKLIKESADIPG